MQKFANGDTPAAQSSFDHFGSVTITLFLRLWLCLAESQRDSRWFPGQLVVTHASVYTPPSVHALLSNSHFSHSLHSPAVPRPGKPPRRDHFLYLESIKNNRRTGEYLPNRPPCLGGPCQSPCLVLRSWTSGSSDPLSSSFLSLSFFALGEGSGGGRGLQRRLIKGLCPQPEQINKGKAGWWGAAG